jgi:ribosome-binding protein aMBF1 (putative translation factor)
MTTTLEKPKNGKKKNENKQLIPLQSVAYFRWNKRSGDILREKRTEKGLSMNEVSQRLEIDFGVIFSLTYVSKLEKGLSKSVEMDKLLALIAILNADINDFFP